MVETTIVPDERGRVSLLPFLKMIQWKHGQAVKVDIVEAVTLPKEKGDI